MPLGPQLLGSGNGGTSKTLTITLDHRVPGDGTLQMIFAAVQTPSDHGHFITASAVDSVGYTWIDSSDPSPGNPLIGLLQQFNDTPPHDEDLEIGSIARACSLADLHVGDTVTVTFYAPAGPGQVFHSSGLLIYIPTYFTSVRQSGVVQYGNGQGFPDGLGTGATADSVNWVNPPPRFWPDYPIPDDPAVMISGMAAYPPSVFTPYETTKIAEITSGVCSLAACYAADVTPESGVNPGGTWASTSELLVANYQFLRALDTFPSVPVFATPHPFKAVE